MNRFRIILITALGALAISSIAASSAQADVYACAFNGAAGPVTAYTGGPAPDSENGVESIVYDATVEQGPDGALIADTDQGNGRAEQGGQDGDYSFTTAAAGGAAACLYVPTGAGAPTRLPGVYPATISSEGEYDNIVCGTGYAIDDDVPASEITSITFNNPGAADITDADYRIDFTAGSGPLDIRDADNADGESGSGQAVDGAVAIEPTAGNCVTTHVTGFAANGAFFGTTS